MARRVWQSQQWIPAFDKLCLDCLMTRVQHEDLAFPHHHHQPLFTIRNTAIIIIIIIWWPEYSMKTIFSSQFSSSMFSLQLSICDCREKSWRKWRKRKRKKKFVKMRWVKKDCKIIEDDRNCFQIIFHSLDPTLTPPPTVAGAGSSWLPGSKPKSKTHLWFSLINTQSST